MVKYALLIVIVLTVSSLGQTPAEGSEKFLGEVTADAYTNEFFGFRITRPRDMYVLTDEQKALYKAAGTEALTADIKSNQAAWAKAATAEIILFSLADHEPGSTPTASLNIGALRQPAGVTSAAVCEAARNFFLLNSKITIEADTAPTKLGGRDASTLEFRIEHGSGVVYSRYYAMMIRGHSVTFVITYLKKDELDRFEKVLSSLEFVR